MKGFAPLAIVLSVSGCQRAGSGTNCKLASADYVGYIDLTRGYGPDQGLEGGPFLNANFGTSAVYFPSATAEPHSAPNFLGLAAASPSFLADCVSIAGSDRCCYVAPPLDAGNGFGDKLSDWNVNVTNASDPDAGAYFAQGQGGCEPSFPLVCDGGSINMQAWSGGDQLLVQGNGFGTVGTFSGQATTPLDVDGLNPELFSPDGGTVSLGHDLALTWTPGGASTVTINAQDTRTFGVVICTVPDNGSFIIPSSALSNFQPGDQGGLAVFRSAESCAYSSNASISILTYTETWTRVLFQ